MTEQAKRVNFLVIHIMTLETRAGKTYTHTKKKKTDQKNKTLKCIFLFKKWGKKHLQ